MKKEDQGDKDNFEVNLEDDRFSALFSRPDYNVDPSHPSFKRTRSSKKIIDEKQRRILSSEEKKSVREDKVDSLVKSVKAKTKAKKSKWK